MTDSFASEQETKLFATEPATAQPSLMKESLSVPNTRAPRGILSFSQKSVEMAFVTESVIPSTHPGVCRV